MSIDFDYWAKLYKVDPEQFNRRREQLLTEAAVKLGQVKILAKIKEQDKILASVKDPEARHKILMELFKSDVASNSIKIKDCLAKY